MKASHTRYARALDALLAAQTALADAATSRGVEIARPLADDDDPTPDDPLELERGALAEADAAFREASAPLTGEIAAAWQRNVDMVQAAKTACIVAMQARVEVGLEVAEAVNERLRNPLWPKGDPLITEVEQARLDAAKAAEDEAVAANTAAEARHKLGVTVDQLAGAG